MKKINYLVFCVFALMMSVSSCKKDDTTSGETLGTAGQMKKLLTSEPWTLVSKIENSDTVAVPDCQKDDFYTFFADGTYSHQVGALLCNGEADSTGTWHLSLDARDFTMNGNPVGLKITNSQLVLTWSTWDIQSDEAIINEQLAFVPRQAR
jgi:hypothetical protein